MNDSPKTEKQLSEELKRARRESEALAMPGYRLPQVTPTPPKDKALILGADEFIT